MPSRVGLAMAHHSRKHPQALCRSPALLSLVRTCPGFHHACSSSPAGRISEPAQQAGYSPLTKQFRTLWGQQRLPLVPGVRMNLAYPSVTIPYPHCLQAGFQLLRTKRSAELGVRKAKKTYQDSKGLELSPDPL